MESRQILLTDYFCKVCGRVLVTEDEITTSICSACLINANRADKIVDTLWVGGVMTLWDYIAQTLEIKGDQIQIEEQILQKISDLEV